MEYITKEYKIPAEIETVIDSMVATGVEGFLRDKFETPVEQKPEYQEAVDTFRADNNMSLKFAKVKPVIESIKE